MHQKFAAIMGYMVHIAYLLNFVGAIQVVYRQSGMAVSPTIEILRYALRTLIMLIGNGQLGGVSL